MKHTTQVRRVIQGLFMRFPDHVINCLIVHTPSLGVVLQTAGLGYPTAALNYLVYQHFLELIPDYQVCEEVKLVRLKESHSLRSAVLDKIRRQE